jgi:hypothetical protein
MKHLSMIALTLLTSALFAAPAGAQAAFETTPERTGEIEFAPAAARPLGPQTRAPGDDTYPEKPDGVPSDIHRQLVQMLERLENAHPDATEKRLFNQIAGELGIAPERLWNAYHRDLGPPGQELDRPMSDTARAGKLDLSRTTDRPARTPEAQAARPQLRAQTQRVERPASVRPSERVRVQRPVERVRPERVAPSGRVG